MKRGSGSGTKDRKINLNASAPKSKPSQPTFKSSPPLKPRRKLFVGLLAALGAWIAILLTLYFTTIYPRHVPGDIRPPEAKGTSAS